MRDCKYIDRYSISHSCSIGICLFRSLFQNNDDENDGNIGSDGGENCDGNAVVVAVAGVAINKQPG